MVLFAIAGALLAAFVFVQTRAAEPVLPLWVFRQRVILSAILVSLVIGVGTKFARCPQHVIANLTGKTLLGAVVNGPNDRSLFSDGLGDFFDEGRSCHRGGHGAFTGHGSRFVDDVRSWQTVEPAIDFTATAALAFALTG